MQSNYGLHWPNTTRGQESLHTLFELSAKKHPENIALVCGNEQMTFKELNDRADNLCHAILNWAYYEDIIAVSSTPGIDMVVGVLAVLKSGKAFMPIDPKAKKSRNIQIVNDSAARFCITGEKEYEAFASLGLNMIFADSGRNYRTINGRRKGSLAYLMYTSGSTCQPKGVKVEHSSLIHYINHAIQHYSSDTSNQSGSFLLLPLTFDASLTALFVPLLTGKKLIIAETLGANAFNDPNFIKHAPYDFVKITPLQFAWLEKRFEVNQSAICNNIVVGGEALHKRHFEFLRGKNLDLHIINEYGPTETTVGCMNYKFHVDDNVLDSPHGIPVGYAIAGMDVKILNDNLEPVSPGNIGEIYISGPQVSKGYLMRPELNDRLFVTLADTNERMFKTGDHALLNDDRSVVYIDRSDYHVQIKNKWVDPDMIEWELSKLKGIKQCKVTIRNVDGQYHILAYIIPDQNGLDHEALRQQLGLELPENMMPEKFIIVNEWPYTSSGKLNRHALPLPECCQSKSRSNRRMPQTEIEKQVAVVWNHVLNLEQCDLDTGFFEMGGNHLQADRLVKLLKRHFGYNTDLSTLYKCSTIACLSSELQKRNLETGVMQASLKEKKASNQSMQLVN